MWTKNCTFCHYSNIKKHGIRNHIQRYKCNICHKTFTYQQKLNATDIWFDYSQGKQTYKALALKYQCSVRTIQRYIEKAPKTKLKPPTSLYLNLIMDTNFFQSRIWRISLDGFTR
ncbi:transposase-like zinc-binding domain-containing protein [Actinobacillus lignieresii]|uniref:IS1/IS1595 family N-terminal zinc-binding domain-containing protein n=1 Tax=Actinobacillus lignieresii TaxID=720 RepID=UPI003BAE4956